MDKWKYKEIKDSNRKNSLKDGGGSSWWKDEKIWVNSLRQFGYIQRRATNGPAKKNELFQGRGKQKTNINRTNKKWHIH